AINEFLHVCEVLQRSVEIDGGDGVVGRSNPRASDRGKRLRAREPLHVRERRAESVDDEGVRIQVGIWRGIVEKGRGGQPRSQNAQGRGFQKNQVEFATKQGCADQARILLQSPAASTA